MSYLYLKHSLEYVIGSQNTLKWVQRPILATPSGVIYVLLVVISHFVIFLFEMKPTSSTDYDCQGGSSCGQWCDGGVAGSKLEKRIPSWFKENVSGKGEQNLRR